MVYLLKMVIFYGYVTHNQMVKLGFAESISRWLGIFSPWEIHENDWGIDVGGIMKIGFFSWFQKGKPMKIWMIIFR